MRQEQGKLIGLCADTTHQIRDECKQLLCTSTVSSKGDANLLECGRPLVSLLGEQARQVSDKLSVSSQPGGAAGQAQSEGTDLVLRRLDDILSIAYSKFYAFLYKDLPLCWRQLYTDASILKFCLLLSRAVPDGISAEPVRVLLLEDAVLAELVKTLDLALILAGGGGERRGRRWIEVAFDMLQQSIPLNEQSHQASNDPERPCKRPRLEDEPTQELGDEVRVDRESSFSIVEPFTPPVRHPINRVAAMPMESFQTHMSNSIDTKSGPAPIIMTGITNEWPARTSNPWNQPGYLLM